MTAYELVDGKYVVQGSPEHISALEKIEYAEEYPTVPTERLIARHFWPLRKVLSRAVVLAGLSR